LYKIIFNTEIQKLLKKNNFLKKEIKPWIWNILNNSKIFSLTNLYKKTKIQKKKFKILFYIKTLKIKQKVNQFKNFSFFKKIIFDLTIGFSEKFLPNYIINTKLLFCQIIAPQTLIKKKNYFWNWNETEKNLSFFNYLK
jgi:hypothetical protein